MRSSEAYARLLKASEEELERAEALDAEHLWPALWFSGADRRQQGQPLRNCGIVWVTDGITPVGAYAILALSATPLLIWFIAQHSIRHYAEEAILFEALLLITIAAANLWLLVRETRMRRTDLAKRLRAILGAYANLCEPDFDFTGHYSSTKLWKVSPSCPLVQVERDQAVVGVPPMLLVQGDVIQLSPGDRSPASLRRLDDDMKLAINQIYQPKTNPHLLDMPTRHAPKAVKPPPPARFEVLQTPLAGHLRRAFKLTKRRPVCVINRERATVMVLLQRIAVVVYSVSLIGNGMRSWLLDEENGSWVEVVLVLPVYTLLPLLPIALPFCWFVANHYAEAKLLALLYDSVLRPRPNGQTGDDAASVDSWESDLVDGADGEVYTSTVSVWAHFLDIWWGSSTELTRSTSVFKVLGDLSVMTFVDKDGVLAEPNPRPSKVFVLSDPQATEDEDDGVRFVSEQALPSQGRGVVLDVIHSPTFFPTGMRFQNPSWSDHLPALKALGLNLLMNSHCSMGTRPKHFTDFLAGVDMWVRQGISNYDFQAAARAPTASQPCLCKLAVEMGFAFDATASYRARQQIVTVAPCHPTIEPVRHEAASSVDFDAPPLTPVGLDHRVMQHVAIPHMVSLIVSVEGHKSLQLLSSGTADLTLDCCEDFWNGGEIVSLTALDRRRIMDFYYSSSLTMKCYAYAYRPVYSAVAEAENLKTVHVLLPSEGDTASINIPSFSDSELAPLSGEHLEDGLAPGSTDSLPDLFHPAESEISRRARTSPDLPRREAHPLWGTDAERDRETVIGTAAYELQTDQIFIGMVAVEQYPYPDVVELVEDLTQAGIRFVYFSKQDELQSKAFASRMGLETGWNCFISLSDDGEGYSDNKAQLPRGIGAIRPHLENIDDVPLLVPMFSDAPARATEDMICIMQENQKVVCCVGSSLNPDNITTFARADMSIGIIVNRGLQADTMATPQCSRPNRKLPLQDPEQSAEQLATLLTSLSCSFLLHRDAEVSFMTLICEARRLSVNLKNAFLFMLWANSLVALTQLLSQIAVLPPILSGVQVVWLVAVPIPLLTLGLLSSPPTPGLAKELTGLQAGRLHGLGRFAVYFIVRIAPTALVCVALFGVALHDMCEERGLSCHPLLGPRNQFGRHTWNGWTSEHIAGLALGQNIVAWLIVLYLCTLSMSFVSRTLSLMEFRPYHNLPWVAAVVAALVTQSAFFAAALQLTSLRGVQFSFGDISVAPYVVAFLWPPVIVLVDTLTKRHDLKLHVLSQKRSKLLFDTKLGMNSPV